MKQTAPPLGNPTKGLYEALLKRLANRRKAEKRKGALNAQQTQSPAEKRLGLEPKAPQQNSTPLKPQIIFLKNQKIIAFSSRDQDFSCQELTLNSDSQLVSVKGKLCLQLLSKKAILLDDLLLTSSQAKRALKVLGTVLLNALNSFLFGPKALPQKIPEVSLQPKQATIELSVLYNKLNHPKILKENRNVSTAAQSILTDMIHLLTGICLPIAVLTRTAPIKTAAYIPEKAKHRLQLHKDELFADKPNTINNEKTAATQP